jgi:HEAT repeat protein
MDTADLEMLLDSSDPEERRRATSELFVRASDAPLGTCSLVLKALADEDWRVRKEAIATAFALAPSRELLDELVRALSVGDNVGLRNAAVEALGGFGVHAVAALGAALGELDADGRKLAVEALGRVGHQSALPILIGVLEDEDPNVRVAAVEAMADLGRTGVSEALKALQNCLAAKEQMLVLAALNGLNGLGVALSFGTVEPLLDQPLLRRPALLAAGRTSAPAAVAPVVAALERASGGAFVELVGALSELARKRELLPLLRQTGAQLSERTRQSLAALCNDEVAFDDARRAAMLAAAALGIESTAELAVSLLGDDRFVAEAHEVLELLGDQAVPALVFAIEGRSLPERATCLSLLGRLAGKSQLELLLKTALEALSDELPEMQREALAVMARCGAADSLAPLARSLPPESSAPTLKAHETALKGLAARHPAEARALAAAADAGGPTAHAACLVIAALAPPKGAPAADLAFLSAALGNASSVVRRAALEAMAEVAVDGAVDALSFAVTDEEEDVREVAVSALGRLRDTQQKAPGFERLLEIVENSQDARLRACALRAIGETHDERAVGVLEPLVRSTTPLIAVVAVEALSKLGGALEALLPALEHADPEVVKAGVFALSEQRDPRVFSGLVSCLEHEAPDIRGLSAELLARHPSESLKQVLRERLASEAHPAVRDAISRALERMSGLKRAPPLVLSGSTPPR